MPGFRHSPLEDIQRIRQDLRDRYADGFPILKELLQNADDAGAGRPGARATQFVIVLCPQGFPGGQHSLLQTPGLGVLNDGDFTAEDANSITSLGLSNKAGQAGAAGKFGLGLKSVFHWAEAFFYFSPHDFPTNSNEQAFGHDLLNPWWSRYTESGRHQEWDQEWERTAPGDHIAFAKFANESLGADRWFGLWIPLRTEAHCHDGQGGVLPIIKDIPPAKPDDLFGGDWRQRLAETLPLLRRVERVQVSVRRDSRTDLLADLRLGRESLRTNPDLLHEWPAQQVSHVLSGRILAHDGFPDSGFAGREWLNPLATLKRLKDHKDWPNQSCIGRDGADRQVPEKAAPHGAVIFTCQQGSDRSVARIQPAVFLPLGEPEEVKCVGATRYNLYLHGFFFVDSGRRRIQDETELPEDLTPERATTEAHVMGLWNQTLMREVVAPLVLPSLDAFAKQEKLEVGQITLLVRAMSGSATLEKLNKWMCKGQRFILRLHRPDSFWEHQMWSAEPTRWIELPETELPDSELFNLMPALEGLACEMAISLRGKPRLADHKPSLPSDEYLARLFGSVRASVFDEPRKLSYLLELIESGDMNRQSDSPAITALIRLVNQLVGEQLPEDSKHANLWKEFFKRLPTTAFIRLPVESAKVSREIAKALATASLPVALLWQDYRDATGSGAIPWATLLPALKELSLLALYQEEPTEQRSNVAVRLLEAAVDKADAWKAQIGNLPLFASREPAGKVRSTRLTQLQAAGAAGCLFTSGESCAQDLVQAAPELKLLLAVPDVTEALKLTAPNCDLAACVGLLKTASRLAADFIRRKPLFERLLPDAHSNGRGEWATLRCLLHGEVHAWQETAVLFDETGAAQVLLKLLAKALAASKQPWRCLPANVVGQLGLTSEHRQQLSLVTVTEATIERLLREVGPMIVDCSGLSTEDCDFILERFNDLEVLRDLNIHEAVDGDRVRIGHHTYVDDGTFQDLPAMCRVTRLRDRPGYARLRQIDGFRLLNWEAVIEIELDQPNPVQQWDVLLTAIGHLGTLRTGLRERVRATAWLPLSDSSAVKPSQLLDLPAAEAELDRLPPEVLNGFLPLLRLLDSVQRHERFVTFRQAVLSPPWEALDTLANLLRPHSNWSTGVSGECNADQINDWVKTLMDAPEKALPVARLVKVLHGQDSLSDFLPVFFQGISGRLSEEAYAGVLKYLADSHDKANSEGRDRILSIEISYLNSITGAGSIFTTTVIETDGVRLVSGSGVAKDPHRLAFPDPSLHPEDQLDDRLSCALTVLRPARPRWAEPVGDVDAFAQQPSAGLVEGLRGYFNPWRALITPCEPVGALLSLLGMGVRSLSSEFFSTWSPEEILDWLDQADQADPSLGSIRDRIARRDFRISIVTEPHAIVSSILGNEFKARLAEQPNSLLVPDEGYSAMVMQEGPRMVCRMRFRKLPLDRGTYTQEVLVNLLCETAALVLAEGLRAIVDVRPLFQKLSEATQLHVAVAQNMIVDQALAFLRQIGAQSHPLLKEALARWDDARRQEAVEEVHEMASRRSAELRRKARDNIRSLLAGEPQVQAAVLSGVKRKLSEFEYKLASVPFEIWQNADDAVAELVRLGRDPNQAATLGFMALEMNDALWFSHWGRLINEFAGPEGSNCRGVGFDRDLEKMLVPAISDKSQITAQGQAALTGKFGLGFKSVFLSTDAPEVLSGSVDFAIRGGIYPVRLDDTQRAIMEHALTDMSPRDWRRGTLIRLPLRGDGSATADQVLALFRNLAPLLVVFSRRLKRLRFRSPNQNETEVSWHPQPLAEGIVFGVMQGVDGLIKNGLVLTRDLGHDRVEFFLGLGTHGIVPLPDHIPVFWVTAPTRATPGYGFAVNGPFEPDVGRDRLASESDKNRQLACDLAGVVSTRLEALWHEATTNWDKLRSVVGMATATTAQALWESLWQVLGRRLADRCGKDDGTTEAKLARRILWSSEADGLQWFYHTCRSLPTGLWGDYSTLTSLPDMHYSAAGALDRESTFHVVGGWPLFRKKVLVGHICSTREVLSALDRLGVHLKAVEPVYLANAVEWELGKNRQADSDIAARLGLLITPEFLKTLVDGSPSERDDREHKALKELLPNTQFQAEDSSWHEPRVLIIPDAEGSEPDEKLRAAFAPQGCRLNPAYSRAALAFFLACRPRLEANVETMANWVLEAASEPKRIAALHYLLKGELKERLAEELRRQRDDSNWLWQLQTELSSWFEAAFPSEGDRQEILAYSLRLFGEHLRQLMEGQQLGEEAGQAETPREPWTVRELWLWWQRQRHLIGDYVLEGEANWPLFHDGDVLGEEQRKAELKRLLLSPIETEGKTLWYRLFGYACLVSAGRQMTELRRFWLERLKPADFWHQTAQGDFSERTRKLFEQAVTAEFTNMAAGGEQAYFWRRIFYDVRKMHRMVANDFPAVLLELVSQGRGEHLRQFLRTGHLPGPDQRRWIGTFGQSADTPLGFIIRELARIGAIPVEAVRPYAFYVCRPVLRALLKIGWIDDTDSGFSGEEWLMKLQEDPEHGPMLLPYYDIPLLHMGIAHRGDKIPMRPN